MKLSKAILWFKILFGLASSIVPNDATTRNPDGSSTGVQNKPKLAPLPKQLATWRQIREYKNGIVDKTPYLLALLKMPYKRFFMVRPRRFGKTVFLGMLYDFFSGLKEEFAGLAAEEVGNVKDIMKKDTPKWIKFPVIHINLFNTRPFESLQEFKKKYKTLLSEIAEKYCVAYDLSILDLGSLIRKLHLKFDLPVVVLIDEYDAPVEHALRNLKSKSLADEITEELDIVFGHIKNNADQIGFAFVIGICKLPLQSMGSGSAGAFEDLTHDSQMVAAFGFTIDEINSQLDPYLERFAEEMSNSTDRKAIQKSRGKIMNNLVKWYDGYHFDDPIDIKKESVRVLNPVSICASLQEYKFTDHWSRTGNVKWIVKMFYESKRQWQFPDFKQPKGHSISLDQIPRKNNVIRTSDLSLPAIMLLYGYVTPSKCDVEGKSVTLVYPNYEVEHHLEKALAEYIPEENRGLQVGYLQRFFNAMDLGTIKDMVEILRKCEFIVYRHPSQTGVTPQEVTRRLNRILHQSGIIFREGADFENDMPTFKKELGGDIDFLTMNLPVNYAISVKCSSGKTGNATGAIRQLVGYLEGKTSNPISFKAVLREYKVNTEEIYLLGLGFTYVSGGTLDNWIFVPYRNGQIEYAAVEASDEQLKTEFLETYTPMKSATSCDDTTTAKLV